MYYNILAVYIAAVTGKFERLALLIMRGGDTMEYLAIIVVILIAATGYIAIIKK